MAEPGIGVRVTGGGWFARLRVHLDGSQRWRNRHFMIPAPGAGLVDGPQFEVEAQVCDADADEPGRNGKRWHVKVYRCRDLGEAQSLCAHLARQAAGLNHAGGTPNSGPWAVVPVGVTGGLDTGPGGDTRPGRSSAEVADAIEAATADWRRAGITDPHRYVLAASPYLEPVDWQTELTEPALYALAALKTVAGGLDAVHHAGWAHGDIKTDHVRHTGRGDQTGDLVLVDADSAVPLFPYARGLRPSDRYLYGRLRGHDLNGPLDPGLVRGHDRFGVALVVLALLAGREWVEAVLLGSDADGTRRIDRPDAVRDALTQLWGRRWTSLIATVTEPFGRDDDGRRPVEAEGWSVSDWLDRVRKAGQERPPEPPPPPEPEPDRFAAELRRIRCDVGRVPTRWQKVELAGRNAEREMLAVAARSAIRYWLLTTVLLSAVGLAAFIGLTGGG